MNSIPEHTYLVLNLERQDTVINEYRYLTDTASSLELYIHVLKVHFKEILNQLLHYFLNL